MVAFKVGAKIVYPPHGIAQVIGRERRDVNGTPRSFLILQVDERGWGTLGGMRISVPEYQLTAVGIRHAIREDDAADVLTVLAVTDARVPSNWSRRFKNHQEKLKSGDVYECAEVVRNLARRKQQASLSAAETGMYARARHTLVAELAVTWNVQEAEAGQRVDAALGLDPNEPAPIWRQDDYFS
jgi:CarD family transcriptional regulator